MERVTISVSDEFAAVLAEFMARHKYENRSEAVRDLARLGLERSQLDESIEGETIATLSYVFNHHTRELAKRLTDIHHAQHDLQMATLHVHLDHDHCLEVAVLRGDATKVMDFAKGVIAERGVRHGQVSFVPLTVDRSTHTHSDNSHTHSHSRPIG